MQTSRIKQPVPVVGNLVFWTYPIHNIVKNKRVVLGQNQSFDKFPIGDVPIACHFVSPLATKILCPIDGSDGIKLKSVNSKQSRWR